MEVCAGFGVVAADAAAVLCCGGCRLGRGASAGAALATGTGARAGDMVVAVSRADSASKAQSGTGGGVGLPLGRAVGLTSVYQSGKGGWVILASVVVVGCAVVSAGGCVAAAEAEKFAELPTSVKGTWKLASEPWPPPTSNLMSDTEWPVFGTKHKISLSMSQQVPGETRWLYRPWVSKAHFL
mmetsp:Transcript_54203/g.168092  ORF Transcript_54203/g.168092 Transcript_54203/m.168092 type:complete len:183 (-) Transcript_54203:569-1117(-)